MAFKADSNKSPRSRDRSKFFTVEGNNNISQPDIMSQEQSHANDSTQKNRTKISAKKSKSVLILSAYLYVPVIFLGALAKYYGGVNEAMVEIMSISYYNYALFHWGGKAVYADTEYGKLKGFTSVSREGTKFYEFLGVPYAAPPIKKLRFKPPIPPLKWEGVKDATGYGPMCSQYDLFLQAVMGEEDCLSLNVYTPKLNISDGTPLPVVLFIHGGMYHFGRAMDFRGHFFMTENIVVVTINYRLQAFGFLNTGDGVVEGNMGLKDQVMAMRWVQRNIANFGGDPNRVTIWGESAGGASTQLHTMSKMSKGLFHGAISHSGFSLAHWSFIRKPREQAIIFAKTLDCPTNSSQEMVKCLRSLDARRMAEIFRGNHDVLHPRLDVFAPTVESGDPDDEETFLSDHPRSILRRGDILTKVPMINGVNAHEGLIYAGYFVRNSTVSEELNSQWSKHAPVLVDYEDLPTQQRDSVSSILWSYYLGNKSVGMESLYEIVDMFSDTSFNKPLEETAIQFSKVAPLYLYLYNQQGEFGVAQAYFRVTLKFPILLDGLFVTAAQIFNKYVFGIEEKHWGVCHADEMALFFKMHPLLSNIKPGHKEYSFSRTLVKNWAHFIRTGVPLPFNGHSWSPVESDKPLKYMQLENVNSPGMVSAPWAERVQFLNSLPGFQCFESGHKNSSSICF